MKASKFTLLFFLSAHVLCAQVERPPVNAANGEFHPAHTACISPATRAMMDAQTAANRALLIEKGTLQATPNRSLVTSFNWPLKQATGFNDPGYFAISNYVDHNPAFPNQLLDYNCGGRTYDLSGGYNHAGVDIFTWPFFWQKMDNNAVEVIAAAAGIIIGKNANDPQDKNCAFCSGCTGNYIIVEHPDGSRALYFHMKNGTLTAKNIGASVAQGEYLGVVGSSGNSTGPHLHFEVWEGNTFSTLIDPYSGACNSMNPSSWWASQPAYRESKINKIMTHFDAPGYSQCYPDVVNATNSFEPGAMAFFGVYLKDERLNHTKTLRLYKPDNTLWQSWTHTPDPNSSEYYSASWWYWYWILPAQGPAGTWRFEVTYQGQTVSHNFEVFSNDCVNNLQVSGSPLPSHTYKSSGDLTATSGGVANGSVVTLTSDTGVLLQNNTEAQLGGVLEVRIEGCAPVSEGNREN